MKLKVERIKNGPTYTIGKMYVDSKYFCDTLEDLDRGLLDSMNVEEVKSKKIYGETGIPKGTYKVTLDIVSPKFSQYLFYMEVCKGKLPRLLDVKGYEGILIHVADGPKKDKLLYGCIGIGERQADDSLANGKKVFKTFYSLLESAKKHGEDITIEIV